MISLEMLQNAIDYIEEHLLEEIHYEEIADYIHMSPYEFHRTFSFIAGITVNTYIRNRRLSLAGQELLQTDSKVIDLAVKYGFDSADGFSKAFARFHGVLPSAAKENGAHLSMYNPLAIHISLEGGKKINYRMEKDCQRRFIALTRAFPVDIINDEDNQDIPDFWGSSYGSGLVDLMKNIRDTKDQRVFGLCAPLVEDQLFFDYGIGIFPEKEQEIEDVLAQLNQQANDKGFENPFTIWSIDEQEYVVFDCFGDDGDCITKAWENFYKEFLPQSRYRSSERTDFEIYFDDAKSGLFCELWIPVE